MAIATLSIDLEARLAKMEQGFDKAYRLAEKNSKAIADKWAGLEAGAAKLGAAIGLAFSATTISAFIRSNADAVDALNDVSDATGDSVENISALEDVARRTGASLEDVSSILVKFNGVLKEADGKNGASQALKAIGVDAEALKKLDPSEALRQTAVALSQFADDGNKARIVQELFGKSVSTAAPFLKDLADAGNLNATVTSEQAAQAEKFNKQLFAFETNISNAARGITLELLPALTSWSEKLARLPGAIGVVDAEMKAKFAGGELKNAVDDLEMLHRALEKAPNSKHFAEALALQETKVHDLTQAAFSANEQLKKLGGDYASAGDSAANASGGSDAPKRKVRDPFGSVATAKTSTDKPAFVGPEVPESYTKALQSLGQTDVVKIRDLNEQLQYLMSLKSSGDQRLGIDQAILNFEESLQKLDPAAKHLQDVQNSVDQLINSDSEHQIQAINEQFDELAKRFQEGSVGAEAYSEALSKLYDHLDSLAPVAKKAGDANSSFWEEGQRNIQDTMGDTLLKLTKGDFKGIGDSWADMLDRMASQALAAQLNEALFGKMGNGTGGAFGGATGGASGGGWLSSAIGWGASLFGGFSSTGAANVASALPGDSLDNFLAITGQRAFGGAVNAGGLYEVNERDQPEQLSMGGRNFLLMPDKPGYVTPMSSGGGAGGGRAGNSLTVQQHFTVPPNTDQRSQSQLVHQAYAGAMRAYARNG